MILTSSQFWIAFISIFVINLFALNFWVWLFQNMFHWKQKKWLIFTIILLMGVISSCAMLLYPTVLKFTSLKIFSAQTITRQNVALLVWYVWTIWLLLSLFWRKESFNQKLLVRSAAFIALAAGIAIWYITLPVGIILYFLCIAGAEEFLKLTVGQSFFAQYKISKKDLLLFVILSAIGFALIENIVYLISDPSIGLAIGRNLTTVIMHIVFTGSMAYIITTRSGDNRWRYIIAFLIGMALHRWYNSFMSYNNPWITTAIIIGGYFIVSYFLYKSDRLYLTKH